MAQVDVARRSGVGILLLVGGLQLLHGRVALRLQPHLVLGLAGLVQGSGLLQETGIVSRESLHEVINLLRRAVMVRVGHFGQPRSIQLNYICHSNNLFLGSYCSSFSLHP